MTQLLAAEVQEFIRQHEQDDVSRLALGKNPFPNLSYPEILNQIAARQKARNKLPTWHGAKGVLFPTPVSVEQTSSEAAARYKASLVSGHLIDLTGGFGVDSFYFSKSCRRVTHCEVNKDLHAIALHNFKVLGADNTTFVNDDGNQVLKSTTESFSWIYVDPSRRHDLKGKVFQLSDCTPDAAEWISLWLEKAPNVMIKTAPMLDLSAGLSQLEHIREIHIVALKGEVRELLWIANRGYDGTVQLKAVDVSTGKTFTTPFGSSPEARFSQPQRFLYEPGPQLLKTGAFADIGNQYGLYKLHPLSHLYTLDDLVDFPGRVFEITSVLPYSKPAMKPLSGQAMNVSVRHFPESVEAIRKRYKIKDGGHRYAFFTTATDDKKIVLLCKKIDA